MINKDEITSVTKVYIDGTSIVRAYSVVANSKTYDVPLDTANTDYQAIQDWIADGGTVIDNPPEETP